MKGRGECKPSGSFDCDAQKTRVSAQDDAFGWLEGAAWDALAGQNDEQKQKQKQKAKAKAEAKAEAEAEADPLRG